MIDIHSKWSQYSLYICRKAALLHKQVRSAVHFNRIWFVIGGQHSPTSRTKQLSIMSCSITHLMRHIDPVIWELQLPNRKTQISVHTHLWNTFGQIPWKNTTCSNSCNFNQYLWLLSIKCILNLRRQNYLPVFRLFLVLPDLVLFIFLLVPDICCVNLRPLLWYTVTAHVSRNS